jgi:FkbM family methyltransferase
MPAARQLARDLALRTPLAPFRRFRSAVAPTPSPRMIRIGTDYGGWSIPDGLVQPDWTVYCAGVGLDATFDLGLIERYGCVVHAFDPTPSTVRYVDTLTVDPARFILHRYALWSQDGEVYLYSHEWADTNFSAINLHGTTSGFTATCRTLPSVMRELGHDHIDLLKLDIEGAEYPVLESVIDGTVRPRVLCVEFHKHDWRIGQMVQTVRRLQGIGYTAVAVRDYDVTLVAA